MGGYCPPYTFLDFRLAIAQSTLLTQASEKAKREATIKRITTLLYSLPTIEYQSALAETIATLGSSGGRLCIKNQPVMESFADCLQLDRQYIKVRSYGDLVC
ncbi:hypothetical protein NIES592_12165 [Fischerella major NIES-592]|uniref:Uncharacterized protein n=1 Tax=Fischerella major NIES-592 TaxID=210994 RepID=A0A1U7GZS2_9CYAN|nr:hypothetical protein NIES592_12165 [Fischerella major NIES-592]